MAIYLFRTVKTASIKTVPANAYYFDYSPLPTPTGFTFANEYYLKLNNPSLGLITHCANSILSAETKLHLKTFHHYCAVFKVNPDKPNEVDEMPFVLFPSAKHSSFDRGTNGNTYREFAEFYDNSNKKYTLNGGYCKLYGYPDSSVSFQADTITNIDPFYGVEIIYDRDGGSPKKFLYLSCVDNSDIFVDRTGTICLLPSGNLARKRFQDFQKIIKYVTPFFYSFRLNKDGKMVDAPSHTCKPFLNCIQNNNVLRKRYIKERFRINRLRFGLVNGATNAYRNQNQFFNASKKWGHNTAANLPDLTAFVLSCDTKNYWLKYPRAILNGDFATLTLKNFSPNFAENVTVPSRVSLDQNSSVSAAFLDFCKRVSFDANEMIEQFVANDWVNVTATHYGFSSFQEQLAGARARPDYALIDRLFHTDAAYIQIEKYWIAEQFRNVYYIRKMAYFEKSLQFQESDVRLTKYALNRDSKNLGTTRFNTCLDTSIARRAGETLPIFKARQIAGFNDVNCRPVNAAKPLFTSTDPGYLWYCVPPRIDTRAVWFATRYEWRLAPHVSSPGEYVPAQQIASNGKDTVIWDNTIHPLDAEEQDAEAVAFLESIEERAKAGESGIYGALEFLAKRYNLPLPPGYIVNPVIQSVLDDINPTDAPDIHFSLPGAPKGYPATFPDGTSLYA